MSVLHSFSIKNIFYDKMDLRLFYFRVTIQPFFFHPKKQKGKLNLDKT